MHISIIGTAGCGKSTLFQALSSTFGSDPGTGTMATIDVPDERLDRLTAIFNPKKTVHARIELSDTPAIDEGEIQKETMNPKVLRQMRLSDAFLLVLRGFDNGLGVEPVAEFRKIQSEFILSDMVQIETRLERIKKQGDKKDNVALVQEKAMLETCLAHLEEGKPLSTLSLPQAEMKNLRGFQFLSQKPMMAVVNCPEEKASDAESVLVDIRPHIPMEIPLVSTCVKLEAELALMSPEDRKEFMSEYGISEVIRPRIIRLAVETLGLISFLTVGEDECRAWPIRKGTSAQEAAGTIHTDFYNKFIRAETVAYDDFIAYNGFEGCKKAGVWRLEGKTYIVQDGDIMNIRAGA